MIKFSIVIPILNESKNIKILANTLRKELNNKFKYEIIFVDDNSKDGSHIILKEQSKKFKNIKFIIRINKKPDLSKSCLTGIKKAKYKYILIMDGDLQHNPSDVPKLINLLHKEDLDIVIGSRNFLKVYKNKSLNFFRYYASIFIKKIVNLFLGYKTDDPLSGFFCFRKKILYKKKLFGKGYKILSDIIYSSKNLNIKDLEIKFNHRSRGKSKMNMRILLLILYFIIFNYLKRFRF
tara:strand:+ start:14 stop:721 length:708 start_codon:yes stop_codon:yes gene_type:complete